MKLSKKAIAEIKKDKGLRAMLSLEMRTTDFSILRWLKDNKTNNPLTTAGALKVIRKVTKMKDAELLISAKEPVAA